MIPARDDRGHSEAGAGAGEPGLHAGRGWDARSKVLLATTVVCLIAAIAGFALYAQARVPEGAAAKFDDVYIGEDKVALSISEQRARLGLKADSDFATYLLHQNMNVYTFRQSVINQVALNMLIDERAAKLGCTPTEAQVDEQVEAMKEQYVTSSKSWEEVLAEQGVTEESLRAQLKTNLAEQAIYRVAVDRAKASDDDVRSYIAANRAGGVEKHSWRATFSGDDARKRAEAFREAVLAQPGGINADAFSALAVRYSDSPTIDEDAGDAGWTYMDASSAYALALADMRAGDVSEVLETETDGNYGVAFCDEVYEYPQGDDGSVDLSQMPETLVDSLRELASEELYKNACSVYLAALLTDAKVTYYPIPDGAVYNIDMHLAQMASGEYLANEG